MSEEEIQNAIEDAIREAAEELYYEGKTLTSSQARAIEKSVRDRADEDEYRRNEYLQYCSVFGGP